MFGSDLERKVWACKENRCIGRTEDTWGGVAKLSKETLAENFYEKVRKSRKLTKRLLFREGVKKSK